MTICVDMDVTSIVLTTNSAQVWGLVGDYEICVYLPIGDPRVRALVGSNSVPVERRKS